MSEQERRDRPLPIARLLPNMLTLVALCAGLSAIRFALMGKWELAVAAIFVAALFDILDGRVARMLRMTSKFGAELDSLGLAPAFVLYRWVLVETEQLGWLAVLAFVVCAALRLARFNTMLEDTSLPAWRKNFFVGVPTPGAALLALLPMIWSFSLETDAVREPVTISFWMMVLAGMMVSRLPVFSLKGQKIARALIVPIFVLTGLIIAQLVTNPWRTVGWVGILYLMIMPYGWYRFYKNVRKQEQP
jgi:CDP-diacylglycerol---serine O-phosphatidyltransferase